MNLRQFKRLWEKDGLEFIEEERRSLNGTTWILFDVVEPQSTYDYGRHYALMVVLGKRGKVIAHNFKNISSATPGPWRQQVDAWWERHLAEGLVDEQGVEICV